MARRGRRRAAPNALRAGLAPDRTRPRSASHRADGRAGPRLWRRRAPPEKTKQKKKKPPPAAPALDEPARRELALQALQFALDVMLRIQEPSAAFLASPGLTKLPAVASRLRARRRRRSPARARLFAAADLPAGALVAFMPVHGIGMDNLLAPGESTLVVLDDDDGAPRPPTRSTAPFPALADEAEAPSLPPSLARAGAYFDAVASCPPYRQCLPGRPARALFFLPPELAASDATPTWIDANPARPLTPGWAGSLVNDGARCDAPDEASVVAYYEASAARKNVALVPAGPRRSWRTRRRARVREGDGCSRRRLPQYRLAAVPGAAERLEVTPRVLAPVREAAACLQERARTSRASTRRSRAARRASAELARQGAPAST